MKLWPVAVSVMLGVVGATAGQPWVGTFLGILAGANFTAYLFLRKLGELATADGQRCRRHNTQPRTEGPENMSHTINLPADDPTVSINLTLGTIVGERCVDAGSYDEPAAYEPITLLDAIVDRASMQIVSLILADRERSSSLRSQITEIRDAMIRERLAPMLDEAFAAPVQRTNDYGVPKGDPLSVRDLVLEAVTSEAKKALKTNPNARYDSDKTLLDRLVSQTVPAVLGKELAAEVAEAKAALRGAVAASASRVLADALTNTVIN